MRSLEGAKFSTLTPSSEDIFKAISPKFGTAVTGTDVSRTLRKLRKMLKNELARGRQISHLGLFWRPLAMKL